MFFYDIKRRRQSELRLRFSPPKGIHCFSTSSSRCSESGWLVSVPRRGFIVFLHEVRVVDGCADPAFQSPEGDSLFFYGDFCARGIVKRVLGFSPPKGIHCFSTCYGLYAIACFGCAFQSPEGDSLFFYNRDSELSPEQVIGFQSPEGDSLFFYWTRRVEELGIDKVSVPRRGFIVFLREEAHNEELEVSFQSPEGDSLFFYENAHGD